MQPLHTPSATPGQQQHATMIHQHVHSGSTTTYASVPGHSQSGQFSQAQTFTVYPQHTAVAAPLHAHQPVHTHQATIQAAPAAGHQQQHVHTQHQHQQHPHQPQHPHQHQHHVHQPQPTAGQQPGQQHGQAGQAGAGQAHAAPTGQLHHHQQLHAHQLATAAAAGSAQAAGAQQASTQPSQHAQQQHPQQHQQQHVSIEPPRYHGTAAATIHTAPASATVAHAPATTASATVTGAATTTGSTQAVPVLPTAARSQTAGRVLQHGTAVAGTALNRGSSHHAKCPCCLKLKRLGTFGQFYNSPQPVCKCTSNHTRLCRVWWPCHAVCVRAVAGCRDARANA